MNIDTFWKLIADARKQVADPADSDAIAALASGLLAAEPLEAIVRAQQVLWNLMAVSYRNPLWAAAYVINGGCSDDGFDYFRGWLITQGQQVFEQAVANPEDLAELPVVRAAAAAERDLECEAALGIAWDAHFKATGRELPSEAFTIAYPALDPAWGPAFKDDAEMARRLPRLSALYHY